MSKLGAYSHYLNAVACDWCRVRSPGRFIVARVLKLVLAHVLMKFNIKMNGTRRVVHKILADDLPSFPSLLTLRVSETSFVLTTGFCYDSVSTPNTEKLSYHSTTISDNHSSRNLELDRHLGSCYRSRRPPTLFRIRMLAKLHSINNQTSQKAK